MAVFSTNQVRQLYVAKEIETSGHVLASDEAGTIAVQSNKAKNDMYFEYKGADNLMRSDLIRVDRILGITATGSDDMAYQKKAVTVTLDANINGGNPVSGQDYLLRILIKRFIGMSDEDQYFKYGMVHAYAGMTPDEFYKILALSLAKNFSREVVPLFKFEVHSATTTSAGNFDGDGYMEVNTFTKDNGKADSTNPYYDGTSAVVTDIDSIRITEVEQPWRLGIMEQVPVYFEVQPDFIRVEGDEVIWGTVTDSVNGTIENGKTIADLEYFCMGERGDIYRGMAWPHNIPTTYLVDPTKKYDLLDIHYYYAGTNEGVQKSEKDITVVCENDGSHTDINSLIGALNKILPTDQQLATL